MNNRGFSLIELIVVIAVIGTLLALVTLQFNSNSKKAGIESQVRSIYADVMDARSQALLQKVPRSVGVSSTQMKIFDGSGSVISQMEFKHSVTFDFSSNVSFDTRGIADSPKTICIQPRGNPSLIDSIVITPTMIQMGKWREGSCTSANITAR